MYSSTFIFAPKLFDAEFHRLDDEIARTARAIPGFLGEEAWHNEDTGLHSEVYYWESRKAVDELMALPHDRWLDTYKVVIAEVTSVYGDDSLALEHVPHAHAG